MTDATTRSTPGIEPRPITSVLVANRGEIARRVFRTCRSLGIATVAVHSDADADAPFVAEADVAVHLPGTAPGDTYLRGDLLADAALRAGADAVHPGYGFLSENADFARAVEAAGLLWIGPPPEAIEAMGSKIEAKAMMAAAGVPVLARLLPDEVTEADLPVLVKASAGGGGRGMRVVRSLVDLPGEIDLASAEAASAFGDPTVFCERYLRTGHHVEVQVLADRHGTVWAVGERECSIQRRHQKVLEEAPSPLVERTPALRQRLFEASVAAARAIGYEGAGTVEFLADDDGGFWFLETNTRLQVEHPVTECTTGLDLVACQLDVAAGARLADAPPPASGHAVEVRIYAEDPAAGFQPQSGTLHRFEVPGVSAWFEVPARAGVRLDSGVEDGSVVGIHYDPMLAKVIAWAPTRDEALRRLVGVLGRSRIHGVTTNRDLLVGILTHDEVVAGHTDTSFLERHDPGELGAAARHGGGPGDLDGGGDAALRRAALAAVLATAARNRTSARMLSGLPSGWRNVVAHPQVKVLRHGDHDLEVRYRLDRDGELVEAAVVEVSADADGIGGLPPARPNGTSRDAPTSTDAGMRVGVASHVGAGTSAGAASDAGMGTGPGAATSPDAGGDAPTDIGTATVTGAGGDSAAGTAWTTLRLVRSDPSTVVLDVDRVRTRFDVAHHPDLVAVDSIQGSFAFTPVDRFPDTAGQDAPGSLLAPMPGSVVRVAAAEGDQVTAGQVLVVLEAMKMQHEIAAPTAGTLAELPVEAGTQVEVGAVLAVVRPPEPEEDP